MTLAQLPITNAQICAIRAKQHGLGMDDATYRELLNRDYGVSSTKDLTRLQANGLLNYLYGGRKPKRNRPARRQPIVNPAAPVTPEAEAGNVYRLPSPLQNKLISELRAEIAWRVENGYTIWLERSLGIEGGAPRTSAEAAKVINGLKGLKRRGGMA